MTLLACTSAASSYDSRPSVTRRPCPTVICVLHQFKLQRITTTAVPKIDIHFFFPFYNYVNAMHTLAGSNCRGLSINQTEIPRTVILELTTVQTSSTDQQYCWQRCYETAQLRCTLQFSSRAARGMPPGTGYGFAVCHARLHMCPFFTSHTMLSLSLKKRTGQAAVDHSQECST